MDYSHNLAAHQTRYFCPGRVSPFQRFRAEPSKQAADLWYGDTSLGRRSYAYPPADTEKQPPHTSGNRDINLLQLIRVFLTGRSSALTRKYFPAITTCPLVLFTSHALTQSEGSPKVPEPKDQESPSADRGGTAGLASPEVAIRHTHQTNGCDDTTPKEIDASGMSPVARLGCASTGFTGSGLSPSPVREMMQGGETAAETSCFIDEPPPLGAGDVTVSCPIEPRHDFGETPTIWRRY